MISLIKKILPAWVKKPLRQLIKMVKYSYRKVLIERAVKNTGAIKIIVGAAETHNKGWYSTNEQWLDITSESDWKNIFGGKVCLSHVVAEHVFEHLTPEEAQEALRLIHQHLLPNGRIRIAVPDGYNPNPIYLEHVKIGGIGDDAADHKQLLTVDVLSKLVEDAGFTSRHVEGYNKSGALIEEPYDSAQGYIMRSRQNSHMPSPWDFPDCQTSLIVDGIKI